jgi:hypothetical protein
MERDDRQHTARDLLRISGSFWEGFALHTAVKLGIFSSIGDGELTDRQVATRLQGDLRGVTMLLNALAAMGLLVKRQDRYANTATSRTFLISSSSQYVGHMILHHHFLVPAWQRLDQAVRTGKPTRHEGPPTDEERESFLMGMFNLAMAIAPGLAKEIDLGGRRHLLDLGGGPGTYAIHFCMENPGLSATIFDLPGTRPFAEETVKRFGMSERIRFVEGNYLRADIPGTYDVAWLSHVLHGEGPRSCEEILGKAVSALSRKGVLFVHDFILSDTFDGPLFPALFSLNMLVHTQEGRAYSEGQIRDMLHKVGIRDVHRLPFLGPNQSGVLKGVK